MINSQNWTHSVFLNHSNQILARITYGAEWKENQFQEVYFLALTNNEHETISEKSFGDLNVAIKEINERYSSWQLKTLSDLDPQKPSGSGCDSCQAH